jgi:pimeloyl-ACP methyl ester carboxylesterase
MFSGPVEACTRCCGLKFRAPGPKTLRRHWPLLSVALMFLQAGTGGRVSAASLPSGFGKIEVGTPGHAITVFTYKPRAYVDGALVVVLHGMLRNADTYCSNAAPLAERFKVLIAAPCFDTNHFSSQDYKLGGVIRKRIVQPREKWTYQRVPEVIDAVRQLEGSPELPYYLIGHSAGGQFAMRYAAVMPPGARRIVAANPGSDLFPRRDWDFGYGFGGLPPELSDEAALRRYVAAPLTLYLGLGDTDPNHFELDQSAAAERQGAFRLARGRACFEYAEKLARQRGWLFNWRKVEVPGIGHDGKEMLAATEVADALFGPEQK